MLGGSGGGALGGSGGEEFDRLGGGEEGWVGGELEEDGGEAATGEFGDGDVDDITQAAKSIHFYHFYQNTSTSN